MSKCPIHKEVDLICPACVGAQGGKQTTTKQAEARRRNGRKGGRPRKLPEEKQAER